MLDVCISAIRNACVSAKNQRNVKGYIYYYNDDGYGLDGNISFCLPKKISNSDVRNDTKGMLYGIGKRSLYSHIHKFLFNISPGFKDKLVGEILKLGFTNYKVLITPLEDETQIIDYRIFGKTVKYERNGKVGNSIYIEISW